MSIPFVTAWMAVYRCEGPWPDLLLVLLGAARAMQRPMGGSWRPGSRGELRRNLTS